jgi:Phospholipase_D-nuclease N-terminal
MSILFGGCGFIGVAFALLAFGFWIWMIVDCVQNPYLQGTDKIVWLLVIIFLHFIGALIYYLVARRRPV